MRWESTGKQAWIGCHAYFFNAPVGILPSKSTFSVKEWINWNDRDGENDSSGDSFDDSSEEDRDSWTNTFDPKYAVKLVSPTDPPLTWESYVAQPQVKNQLKCICEAAAGSDKSNAIPSYLSQVQLAVLRITRSNAGDAHLHTSHRIVLLHGPSGNDKTQSVRVMASVLKNTEVSVFHVDLTSLTSTWYKQTEHQLKSVLSYIGRIRNSIVFIDEIDSFVGESNRKDQHRAPLLTQVLQWINGIDSDASRNLTILCATNHLGQCDPAFVSRCSLKIVIPKPSPELCLQWWNQKARHLTQEKRAQLASYKVDSFRFLQQMVNQLVEDSAYTLGVSPCFADYADRLEHSVEEKEIHPLLLLFPIRTLRSERRTRRDAILTMLLNACMPLS